MSLHLLPFLLKICFIILVFTSRAMNNIRQQDNYILTHGHYSPTNLIHYTIIVYEKNKLNLPSSLVLYDVIIENGPSSTVNAAIDTI